MNVLFLFCMLTRAAFAGETAPPASSPGLYASLVAAYLDGKWDEVEQTLSAKSKDLAVLTDAKEKANVTYLRQTMAECRPPWWKTCKAGQRTGFKPLVWGRSLDAIYEPGPKPNMQMRITSFQTTATITCPAAEMDDPSPAEHGFSKGDLCDLNIWASLGTADAYSMVPISAQAQMDDAGRLLVGLFGAFRGNLTGGYFGTPCARRWDLWLDLAAHGDKSGKSKDIMARRAVASAFMAELLTHPDKYPSIHLPDSIPTGATEEELAKALKPWIEKHGWTFAEDRALRDALKVFGTTNAKDVWRTGIVKLANGQTIALEPDKDGELQTKRDAWVSAAFEKTRGK